MSWYLLLFFNQVFANKVSIKQQEHYNANKLGLRPEVAFEVRAEGSIMGS